MPTQNTVTDAERQKVLETYLKDGSLTVLPSKEKRRRVVLEHIKECFIAGQTYTEKEVNAILKPVYNDFVLIRRYLIDYKFLERSKDGMSYWVKENSCKNERVMK